MISSCPRCHASFHCRAHDRSCWCGEIGLGADTLRVLSQTYDGCLCRACIEDYRQCPGAGLDDTTSAVEAIEAIGRTDGPQPAIPGR